MPLPTRSQVHVDRPLTNISIAYTQEQTNYIADKVFPIVPVLKKSDLYFTYDKGDWLRDEAQERAPGTESAGGGYRLNADANYSCRRYAYHTGLDDERRANSDDPLAPETDDTLYVTEKLLIKREKLWQTKYFKTGVWATDLTGVSGAPTAGQFKQWNDPASTPIKDISTQITVVAGRTGKRPNKLVLDPQTFQTLRSNPDIRDAIKYVGHAGVRNVSEVILAEVFGVDEVLVAWAVVNPSKEGIAETTGFIMPKGALLCYANPAPALRQPSAGYIFAWTGIFGASAYGTRIKRIPMPWLGDDYTRIEGEMFFDQKLVGADLATFFTTTVA